MLQKIWWQQMPYLSLSNSFHDGPKSRDCSNPYWTTMERTESLRCIQHQEQNYLKQNLKISTFKLH